MRAVQQLAQALIFGSAGAYAVLHVALVPVAIGDDRAEVFVLFLYRNTAFSAVDPNTQVELAGLHEGVGVALLAGSASDQSEKNGSFAVVDSHVQGFKRF